MTPQTNAPAIDPNYIVGMLKICRVFSENEKQQIQAKLPEMTGWQVLRLQQILEKEEGIMQRYYETVTENYHQLAEKKVALVYDYAEKRLEESEQEEMSHIDEMLEEAEGENIETEEAPNPAQG